MAEKRMFTMKIVDSDPFKEMPLSAQALYFHLGMNADDEGFLNNAKGVQRSILASEDDMKLLIAKKFIIPFESGVVVIKHWKMHNTIQPSRLKPTQYIEEKSLLAVKENKAYTLNLNHVDNMPTNCRQNVAEIRVDESRLDKISIVESSVVETAPPAPTPITYDYLISQYGKAFVDERIERSKRYTKTNNLQTVAKWCSEDAKKIKTEQIPSHMKPGFNDFMKQDYGNMDDLESALLNNQDPEFLKRKEALQERLRTKYSKGDQNEGN